MSEEHIKKNQIRYPIRFKIFLVSLVPTIALLFAALLNNQYLEDLGDSAEQILSKNYKSIRAAQEARKALEGIRNILQENRSTRIAIAIREETLNKIVTNLTACRKNITEVGEQELIDRIFDNFDSYENLAMAMQENNNEIQQREQVEKFLELSANMVVLIDDLVTINETAMERAEQQTRVLAQQAQRNAALLFGVIIIAILALSYFLSYRIAKPIMTLARRISSIQEGSGVYPVVRSETNDEIGFLTKAFNHLFNRLKQYDHHRDEIIAVEREKVRRSEEAKGKFIADISHQLKTPMTSLAMSVGMMRNQGDDLSKEKKSKLVATAYDDCARLTSLINELVDISRLEAMSHPRPKETLDIEIVISECLAPLRKQAENKGVFMKTDIPQSLPQVTIDSFRFPWVITNLVGNALRYTDRGGRIGLKVYKHGSRFYFQCRDTGSGINPKYLSHIFDRFTQFSERGKSGTIGLGLAIVKDIIEQHGGDIDVESEVGKGTCFTFWIPGEGEEEREENINHR